MGTTYTGAATPPSRRPVPGTMLPICSRGPHRHAACTSRHRVIHAAETDRRSQMRTREDLEEFRRRATLVVFLVMGAVVALALLVLGIDILLAAFAGILFAVLLRGLAVPLAGATGLPEGVSLAAVVLLLLGVGVGGGWLLGPGILEQIDEVGDVLPGLVEDLESMARGLPLGDEVIDQFSDGEDTEWVTNIAASVAGALGRWSTYLLTAFFVGLFGAVNPKLYREATAHLFPLRHRDTVREMFDEVGKTLRWWLLGQAVTMLLIGVSIGLLLWAFGIPLALPLGVVVGALGFIPYLGPILGLVPVALVAATAGASTWVMVMIGYIVIQNIEGYVVLPLVHQQTVYLPPVFTIVSQILLGTVLGVLGWILATPIAVVLLVLTAFYRRHLLGDVEAENPGR
ncbi:MAG: AI-2E family transporter [Gemmatimonadales bacterium]|nr:MAG: AI-2E family transporter [Gemmatimonadales bacterium]